jgi:hypothetical protein
MEIPANVPITEFRGNICTAEQLPEDSSIYLQIGPNTFLMPTGTVVGADFINHACQPNCTVRAVGNRVILYSLYVIPKNTELTFDYSTTSTDTYDTWKMECKCPAFKCRKIISGFQYLDSQLKEDYIKRGLVPIYISHPNLILKR